ncbi:NlpC/P60 family protein [Plantactinospora sp. KBS50]|uniref:C40 family peptidase n=1 Tax=Plantactinospora sp. KBS50 TaxID=2024580 RepID=UPI000BAAFB73|nr:C40 family peptidase [Plantactinospora sp. KBS50]ASW52995.1 glycoside hydrolase [Plantactinospora sp. KBS50]
MASHAPRPGSARRPAAGVGFRSRPRWSVVSVALTAVASALTLLVGAAPVHADPSVSEIEKQIDDEWGKLEPTIEKHNAARQDLAAKRKQVAALEKKIQPLQLQVDLAMNKVGGFAVEAYKGDQASALNAILTTGDPNALVDQLQLLDQFARKQQRDVEDAVKLKNEYAAKKAPLDLLVAQLTKTEAELSAKAKEIDAEIDRLQKLRTKVYGDGGGGVFAPAPCPATYPGGSAGTVVKFACKQIGKPYVWGADGPSSYDCSGLTMAAWAQVGVHLPHNAAQQYNSMTHISRGSLRPGDLVFYNSLAHVGMYVGNGWVVHAPQSGDHVRMRKIDVGSIVGYGRPR